jgi:hypothetical protein
MHLTVAPGPLDQERVVIREDDSVEMSPRALSSDDTPAADTLRAIWPHRHTATRHRGPRLNTLGPVKPLNMARQPTAPSADTASGGASRMLVATVKAKATP